MSESRENTMVSLQMSVILPGPSHRHHHQCIIIIITGGGSVVVIIITIMYQFIIMAIITTTMRVQVYAQLSGDFKERTWRHRHRSSGSPYTLRGLDP